MQSIQSHEFMRKVSLISYYSYRPKLRGVHAPEAIIHFPPVSDFPLFPKNFRTPLKIFPILAFQKTFSIFIRLF